MMSPLILSRQASPHDQQHRKKEEKALHMPKLTKEAEVKQLQQRLADYERREPQLNKTIRQLEKQLDIAKDNTERWKIASQGDVRPGSQYRQEIALLKQQLEEQKECVRERDMAIENLTAHLQTPTSQNTSVCSSLVDELESSQTQEMEKLLKDNSVYAHRLLEQDNELVRLRNEKVDWERERIALGKKVAAMTFQQAHEKKEIDTIKKESVSLEKQVSILQRELWESRAKKSVDDDPSKSKPESNHEDPPSLSFKDVPPYSNPRDSSRNMKRIMELQYELRKVTKENESKDDEVVQIRKERDSLRQEVAQARSANQAEIKQLRNDLWKAKVFSESMEDMLAEMDQTKFAHPGSKRNQEDTSTTLKIKFREMSQTIVRLQSEIRKRDAAIADLEMTSEKERDTKNYLMVQRETPSLETELDRAPVDLEKASKDHADQQKRLQGLQVIVRSRNETIMKLQREVKARTESLLKTRKEMVEKEKTIEDLQVAQDLATTICTKDVEVLRNKLAESQEEIVRLQEELLERRNSLAKSRQELAEKNSKITELETAMRSAEAENLSSPNPVQHMSERSVLWATYQDNGRQSEKMKSEREKMTFLERTIIEKDIKIEELEIDLDAARSSVAESICKEGEGASRKRSILRTPEEMLPEKELLERQLSAKDESMEKVQNFAKELGDSLEKALAEKKEPQDKIHENEKLCEDIESYKTAAEMLREQLDSKEAIVTQYVAEMDRLRRDSEKHTLALETMKQEIAEKEKAISTECTVSDDLRQDLKSARQDLEVQKKNHEQLQQEHLRQNVDRESKIEELESVKKELAESLKSIRNEYDLSEAQCAKLRSEIGEKETDVANFLRDSESHNETIGQIRRDMEERDAEIAGLVAAKKATELSLAKSRDECIESKNGQDELRNLLDDRNSELESLRLKLESNEQELGEKDRQIIDLTEAKRVLDKTLEHATSEVSAMVSDSARIRKVLHEKNDENEHLLGEMDLHQQKLDKAMQELEASKARIFQLEYFLGRKNDELEGVLSERDALEKLLGDCNGLLATRQNEKSALIEELMRERQKDIPKRRGLDFPFTKGEGGNTMEDFEEIHRKSSEEINLLRQRLRQFENVTKDVQCTARDPDFDDAVERLTPVQELETVKANMSEELISLRDKLRELVAQNESLKTDLTSKASEKAAVLQEGAKKDKQILVLEGEMSKSIDALQSVCADIETKEQTIIELCTTKAELSVIANIVEQKLCELADVGNAPKQHNNLNSASDVRSCPLLDCDTLQVDHREKTLQEILLLIEGGLESVEELEKLKIEASTEALDLKPSLSQKTGDIEELKKELEVYTGKIVSLRKQLDVRESEVDYLKTLNDRETSEAQKLCQIVSSKAAENARMRNDIDRYAEDVTKLHQQLDEASSRYKISNAEKKTLDACCDELKSQVQSLKSEKSSLEEELLLSREEVFAKNSALEDLRQAVTDSSDARENLQLTMRSMEQEIERLKQHLSTKTQNLADARHDLLEKDDLLSKARQEITRMDSALLKMETRRQDTNVIFSENSSLRLQLETAKQDLQSVTEEHKCVKAETERKKAQLKTLSEETEHLKINFMRQHDELKTLSQENLDLKSAAARKQVELDNVHEELLEKVKEADALKNAATRKLKEALDLATAADKNRELETRQRGIVENKARSLQQTSCRLERQPDEEYTAVKLLETEGRVYNQTLLEIENLKLENSSHLKELEDKTAMIQELEAEVQRLKGAFAENNDLKSLNTDLTTKIKEMIATTDELKKEVTDRRKVSPVIDSAESLRKELEEAKKSSRETVQAYERQICALTMNKDVTIDTLRKDLANARSRNAEEVARLTNELSKSQAENTELEKQCNKESIRMRDQRIYALEHTLLAQEKTVDSLRAELDQLQVSMSNAAEQRRQDLHELQLELSEGQSNLQKQSRECIALKARLDDNKIRHDAEVNELKKEINRLQSSSDARRIKDLSQMGMMNDVKIRLEQLKETNVELKEQNSRLADRLEMASEKVKIIQAEKEAAIEMEEECADLRRQVKELEAQLENSSGGASKSDSMAKSRVSESSSILTVKETSKENRGLGGLSMGRRPRLAGGGKTKIPSVLFIGRPKDSSSERQKNSNSAKGLGK
jgi:chromosome segregation ATPase